MARRVALLSVFDKKDVAEFAQALVELDFDIIASRGTAKALLADGIDVTDVAKFVGGKAILDHRVVTLSRELYAGLLATESQADVDELKALGIRRIDLVRVDMYPLLDEIENPHATFQSVIEQTDVGGPTMLYGGAKGERIVVCDSADCDSVLEWLRDSMPSREEFVRTLMAKAEATVAQYIFHSAYFHGQGEFAGLLGQRCMPLRYGEGPTQQADWYRAFETGTKDMLALDKFELVGGECPSYINITDVDRMLNTMVRIAAGLEQNGGVLSIAIAVKHGNSCGVGVAADPLIAIQKMIYSDPGSLFGGCVLVNFSISEEIADLLRTGFLESGSRPLDVVAAPEFREGAKERLSRANGKCRMFMNSALGNLGTESLDITPQIRQVRGGGFLRQQPNMFVLKISPEWEDLLVGTQKLDLVIAWAISATSNSNTIVIVHDGMLLGRGIAQPSRVLACKFALFHAHENGHDEQLERGFVAASDSFFPFPDGPEVLADAGAQVIFATSGSINDDKVRQVCEQSGVKLLQLPDSEARGFFGH